MANNTYINNEALIGGVIYVNGVGQNMTLQNNTYLSNKSPLGGVISLEQGGVFLEG